MAFTKTMIKGNMQTLHTAMQTLVTAGIFKAVSISGDSTYTITCTDADDNVLLTIVGASGEQVAKTITAYISESTSKALSNVYVDHIITAPTGAYIALWASSSYSQVVLIGKTNSGKPCIMAADSMSVSGTYGQMCKVFPITWGASRLLGLYYQNIQGNETQTFLHAIPGFPASPEPLYFPNLMIANLTQYAYNGAAAPYEVSDGTDSFYTNGLLFLKDGGAS